MPFFETTTEINATTEHVWDIYTAVAIWPDWLPTVDNVDVLDGMPLKAGRRFRVTQPKLRPAVWTVEKLEPGHRFRWHSRSTGIELIADHVIDKLDSDTSQIRLSFEFKGFLGTLPGLIYGSLTHDYIHQEAQAVKSRAELLK